MKLEDLTDDQKQRIEDVYAEGKTVQETAGRLGLPRQIVGQHLRARGLTRTTRETCGQNRRHPWNMQGRVVYLQSLIRQREAEA